MLCFQKSSQLKDVHFSQVQKFLNDRVATNNSRILFSPRKIEVSSTPLIFVVLTTKKIEFTKSSTLVVSDGSKRITAIWATKLFSESRSDFRVSLLLSEASLGHWLILSINKKSREDLPF